MKVPKFIVGCAIAFAILCILLLSGCAPQSFVSTTKNEEVVIKVIRFDPPPGLYFTYIDTRTGKEVSVYRKYCSAYRKERDNIAEGNSYTVVVTTTNYVDVDGKFLYSDETDNCELLKQLPFKNAA